jgi:hypothetical protein
VSSSLAHHQSSIVIRIPHPHLISSAWHGGMAWFISISIFHFIILGWVGETDENKQ